MFSREGIQALPRMMHSRAAEIQRDLKQMRRREPNVLTFITYGLLFDMVVNLWKPFSIKFLERLGGGELEISLLNALPGLVAAMVLLPGALLLSRLRNVKKATAAFILISRAILLLIAFIPALPPSARPMLFVVLIAVMNCPDALSQTSLQSFLGRLFGGTTRAQAITLRNKFGNAVMPVVTIATGLAITYIPSNEGQRMLLYQIFFAGAFGIGLIEVFVFNRFKTAAADEEQTKTAPAGADFSAVREVLRNKKFTSFFLPVLFFAFCWQAGWPLCGIYQVQRLHANELWFAIFSLASAGGAFFSAGFWQKFIRKHGNAVTLLLSTAMLAFNLILFPLSPNVYVLTLISPVGGIASLGLNIAMLNGVLEATPDENRLVYLASYNTAMNLSLFLAPIFSHLLLSTFGMTAAFCLIAGGRLLASGVIALRFHLIPLKRHSSRSNSSGE